jgi:biopolymer transport protein ExbB
MPRRREWIMTLAACGITLWVATQAGAQPVADQGESVVEINYFQRFIRDGGLITWLILLPTSMATGALVTQGLLNIRRATMIPDDVREEIQTLFDKRMYREAVEYTAGEPSLLSHTIHAGLGSASQGHHTMTETMVQANEDRITLMLRRIEYLNLIGNISPMVGLFGTVFGMIKAFNAIVAVGGAPEPSKLADGISTALVTTFWGLLIAIPSLFFYALFRNRVEALGEECAVVAEEMLAVFRPGHASQTPAATQPKQAAPAAPPAAPAKT